MVDVLGHLGMALIWLAPAWYFVDTRKTATTFVGLSFWFGMLPDVDLVLSNWFAGIHHHGVFHTVLMVTAFAITVGPLLGWVFRKVGTRSDWFSERATHSAYEMGVIAIWVTGLSHLFADILSAPDTSTIIEPFWPVFHGGLFHIDVLYYQSFWATWALLAVGVALNVAAWVWKGRSQEPRGGAATSQ